MAAAVDDDRDVEVLREIAEALGVSPEALIEGTTDKSFAAISQDKADRAQLCRCPGCGDIMGCEHDECAECR